MENQEAKELLDKYLSGKCTPEEKVLVEKAYNFESSTSNTDLSEEKYEAFKADIWHGLKITQPNKITPIWRRVAAAAAILIFLSTGGYFLLHYLQPSKQLITASQITDVVPGSNSATLTLANGQQVILKHGNKGQIAVQGNMSVNKTSDGQIEYHKIDNTENRPEINIVTTKRKEQYQVKLSDGTRAWLNAESSIKYPVTFTEDKREVEITGEVYFEVAHNAAKPFLVQSKDQSVQVLGTHFDVNAYPDENGIKTTLVEGSVKVFQNSNKTYRMLVPGQQAILINDDFKVSQTDTEQATAWKDGDFIFNDDIKSIMRQIVRWYDVDVRYQGKITNEEFLASIPRSKNISQVLKALELTHKVHFKVEGRRILVMP